MAYPTTRRADVYWQTVDMSQVATTVSLTIGAIVGATTRGPLVSYKDLTQLAAVQTTTTTGWTTLFGEPDPTLSYVAYSAVAFHEYSNTLWTQRVCGDGYYYGAMMLWYDANSGYDTANSLLKTTVSDLSLFDFTLKYYGDSSGALVQGDNTFNSAADNLVLFYPYYGPYDDSSNIAMSISSPLMGAPTDTKSFTVSQVTTGGSLGSGTYNISVRAINKYGEMAVGADQTVTIAVPTGGSSTYRLLVSLTGLTGAASYKIYIKKSTDTTWYLSKTTSSTTTYIKSYTAGTDTLYTDNAYEDQYWYSSDYLTLVKVFTVSAYDLSVSTKASETWSCSLQANTDGLGNQTQIDEQLNKKSALLRCINNASSLSDPPLVGNITRTAFPDGSGGAAVTTSDIIEGWEVFSDTQKYQVRLLINAGYTSTVVQLKMNTVATERDDCIAFLDTPSDSQSASNALLWRSQELALDSYRSAIFAQDLLVYDSYNGMQLYVPPSGYMAALCVNSEYVAEPWFAMAGTKRGNLTSTLSVLGVRQLYTLDEMGTLADAQVNYIRNLEGRGLVLMEQWTLQSTLSALSWISVVRAIDYIHISSVAFSFDYLHDPNDDILAAAVISGITSICQEVKDGRGLSDFKIVSNTTNTQLGNGQRWIQLWLTPTLPCQQIVLVGNITQQGADLQTMSASGS